MNMTTPKKLFLPTLLCLSFILLASLTVPLPKLYVIGDSISMQYGPYLEKYTRGTWQYARKGDKEQAAKNLDIPTGANGGDSRMVLNFLQKILQDQTFQPDLMLLNCGLHDIKRDAGTNTIQVDSASYRSNLNAILDLLKNRDIRVVWMRTTPVDDERHNSRSKAFKRYARDLTAYNAIADEVMNQNEVPIIDLYTFTKNLGDDHYVDHVHFDEATRAAHAAYIAGYLNGMNEKR